MSISRNLSAAHARSDDIVAAIYRAGSGLESWQAPIRAIAEVLDAWVVQFLCVNRRNGVIQWAYEAGAASPAAAVDFLSRYHQIDPRLKDLVQLPLNGWYSCEEHFDDAAVAADRYYTEYLIPYGGRYCYAGKIFEDESMLVLIGAITRTGQPPMSGPEKEAFARLAGHFAQALNIEQERARHADRTSVGVDLLERMRQPMILIDSQRRITYRNRNAKDLLARGDLVSEIDGMLMCRDNESDLDLTIALRELGLVAMTNYAPGHVPGERRSLRLRRRDRRSVAATVLAIRPETTMGGFGRVPQALFTLFEPGAAVDIDPFVLSTTFDLTPAEARLALHIVNGKSPEECAAEFGVKVSTIRTQLLSVFRKTGAGTQADLVRLVLSATAI